MLRAAPLWLALVAVAAPAGADVLPAPARWGDVSWGVGPAFVGGASGFGGGAAAEANLLYGAFSLGVKGRLTGGEEVRAAAGLEASVLGLVGAGASVQKGGPSVDLLVQAPLPLLRSPWYLTLGYRPQFLLGPDRGVIHELALSLKWTTLLLPDER